MTDATRLELPLETTLHLRQAAERLRREFSGTFAVETIERFLDQSLDAILATARLPQWVPIFAERFARERLRALMRVEGHGDGRSAVLFLCTHNAGRSQMAAGWLRHIAGGEVEIFSGGSDPASEVNPMAIAAMAEVGVDISSEFPKPWTDEVVRAADVVVTMGCGDACPLYPGKRYEDWELADPAGQDLASVRPIRDDIEQRVRGLVASLEAGVRA